MGTKSSKELLPLLHEQSRNAIIYSSSVLYDAYCITCNLIDKYVEDENEVALIRFRDKLYRLEYTNSIDYVRTKDVPVMVHYNMDDRMSWYKALDAIGKVKGTKILIGIGTTTTTLSVGINDVSQLADDINHYEIMLDRYLERNLISILEEHVSF